jgi:excisionase family DNA binding protein
MTQETYDPVKVGTADRAGAGEPIKVITFSELTNYLQISDSTIRQLVRQNRMPKPFTIGGARLYWRLADIDAWIERAHSAAINGAPLSSY